MISFEQCVGRERFLNNPIFISFFLSKLKKIQNKFKNGTNQANNQ